MLTEIRSNGNLSLRLIAESKIEDIAIDMLLTAVSKGQTVHITGSIGENEPTVLIMELETKH